METINVLPAREVFSFSIAGKVVEVVADYCSDNLSYCIERVRKNQVMLASMAATVESEKRDISKSEAQRIVDGIRPVLKKVIGAASYKELSAAVCNGGSEADAVMPMSQIYSHIARGVVERMDEKRYAAISHYLDEVPESDQ